MTRWIIHEYAEIGSTQDEIRRVIDAQTRENSAACSSPAHTKLAHTKPAPPRIVVRADKQTKGRGRANNVWRSEEGNFFATFALAFPQNDPEFLKNAANYSFVATLSVSESLKFFLDDAALFLQSAKLESLPQIQHKWPNDILINGQKIAGILIEIYDPYILIGIGVNLAHAPALPTSPSPSAPASLSATALSHYVAPPPPSVFLQTLSTQLDRFCGVLQHDGFAAIRSLWLKNAYGIGGPVTVRTPHEVFTGEFKDLEPDGALRVFDPAQQKIRKIYSADIFFNEAQDAADH